MICLQTLKSNKLNGFRRSGYLATELRTQEVRFEGRAMVVLISTVLLVLLGLMVALSRGASGVSHADAEPVRVRRRA